MKKTLIIFLKAIVILIGISVLILMLWEPHLEGRNVNATLYQIYFHDPFLAYAYTGSIAFFIALYQILKILGYIEKKEAFSRHFVKALRIIKYCAMIIITFVTGAEIYFFTVQRGKEDDIIGGVAIGLFIIFISAIVAAIAAKFEKRLQNAIK